MKIRVLAVDDNKALIEMLKEYFSSKEKEIEVTNEAYDGEMAWQKIQNERDTFDVLLLDLIMPKKDGLYVLERLKQNNISLNTIVVTSYNEQETIRSVGEYGVRYFVLKPFDLQELTKKIKEVNESGKRKNDIITLQNGKEQLMITKILHDLGIPSHIKGYQYIREAINLVYNNPALIGGITKELYPEIGNKFDTSVTRVERAIRHAIEISWNRGDWDLMEEIFGHSVDIDKAKPTNSEFIVTIADKMRLDTNKVR